MIISPLLALITDQVISLRSKNICAATISSDISQANRKTVIKDLYNNVPNTKPLYVTHEQSYTSTFNGLITYLCQTNKLSYFVVEEAHCVDKYV